MFSSRTTPPEISKITTYSQTPSNCFINRSLALLCFVWHFHSFGTREPCCCCCLLVLPWPSFFRQQQTCHLISTVDWTTAQAFLMTHPALFDKGSPLPDNTQIFTSPWAASLWPTAACQFLSGHCTTHAGAVRHKKAAGDCNEPQIHQNSYRTMLFMSKKVIIIIINNKILSFVSRCSHFRM